MGLAKSVLISLLGDRSRLFNFEYIRLELGRRQFEKFGVSGLIPSERTLGYGRVVILKASQLVLVKRAHSPVFEVVH